MNPPATGVRRKAGHKACVSCKSVKLRCIRERSDLPCERCTLSGDDCRLPEKRPRKSRPGTRLELAKALYGASSESSVQPNAGDLASFSGTDLPDTDWMQPMPELWENDVHGGETMAPDTSLSWTRHTDLWEQSAEDTLATVELCNQFSSHLMEEFFVTAESPIPLKQWKNFRMQFEEAGRVPERLSSPITQVMAALLIAQGARITAAPCILGNGAVWSDVGRGDLSYFGRRRAAACKALENRAAQLADERGLFRSETIESVRVLMMLSQHLDHNDPCRKKGRPYRVAAASHARSIAEDCGPIQDWLDLVGGPLGYLLFIQDTWTSASSLMATTFVEDESLARPYVRPYVDCALPTITDLHRALSDSGSTWSPGYDSGIWRPIGLMWGYMTNLMRHVNNYLRQGPQSAEIWNVIKETYNRLDQHRTCYLSLGVALGNLFDPQKPGVKLLRHYFATAPTPNLLITFYIHRALKYWSETFSVYGSLPPESLLDLVGLKAESDRRMADGARELAQSFDSLLVIHASRRGMACIPEVGLMYETLPVWAETLSSIPTAQDGFPTSYTLEEKVKEMTRFLDALHALGWSWADSTLTDTIARMEQNLSGLRSSLTAWLCDIIL